MTKVVLDGIGRLYGWLLDGLVSILKAIFTPILILISIIFYFVYKIGDIFVMIFQVLLGIGKLLYSLIQGLVVTFAGFSWTPTTPDHGSWSHPINQAFSVLEDFYQLDTVAYVVLFLIWIMTAYTAIRMITGRGGAA